MNQLATITSKRQLTIPIAIFKQLNFKKGQRVMIGLQKRRIIIRPVFDLVEELAGSVKTPSRFKGKKADQLVKLAKEEYFKNKK